MERSGDWMNQARSDLEHARHDLEAEFYGQRMQDHGRSQRRDSGIRGPRRTVEAARDVL